MQVFPAVPTCTASCDFTDTLGQNNNLCSLCGSDCHPCGANKAASHTSAQIPGWCMLWIVFSSCSDENINSRKKRFTIFLPLFLNMLPLACIVSGCLTSEVSKISMILSSCSKVSLDQDGMGLSLLTPSSSRCSQLIAGQFSLRLE